MSSSMACIKQATSDPKLSAQSNIKYGSGPENVDALMSTEILWTQKSTLPSDHMGADDGTGKSNRRANAVSALNPTTNRSRNEMRDASL